MKFGSTIISIGLLAGVFYSCHFPSTENPAGSSGEADQDLAEYISHIKAVDNHAHPNSILANDRGYDALPLDALGNMELPARVRTDSRAWLEPAHNLYGFSGTEWNGQSGETLVPAAQAKMKEKGAAFPEWALDQAGVEVMLANRISLGPGLSPPRFRWVSYVDAFLFPLNNQGEASLTPDRKNLFPMEDQLLRKYMADHQLTTLPASLDEYLEKLVRPTLETQKKAGCVAVKFEAAYLRSLDFQVSPHDSAKKIYKQYLHGGLPPHEKYKQLQDYIFYYIAGEAGRLAMPVHIHSFSGAGDYFVGGGSDPMLLETAINDSSLRHTRFVLIHGGGVFFHHTSSLLWKPNFYADISLLTQIWSPAELAAVLREWLAQFPEKIVYGSDASAFGPGLGWEVSSAMASTTARQALGLALTAMVRDNEITRDRAREMATMVLRTNAAKLYQLNLP